MFFENQYFFRHHLDRAPSPVSSLVPDFDDPPDPPTENIKPILVYERCRREHTVTVEPPDLSVSSALDSAPAPDISQTVPFRPSFRLSRPPDRFDFTQTSLLATLSSVHIPNHFSQAVHHECWRQAMQEELDALQVKITHGMLFNVLRPSNPLAVSGFTLSSYIRMVLWHVIRLG